MKNQTNTFTPESYLLVEYPDGTHEWHVYHRDLAFSYEDKYLQHGQGIDSKPTAFATMEEVTAWCSANGREALAEQLRGILAQPTRELQEPTQAEKDAVFASIAANI